MTIDSEEQIELYINALDQSTDVSSAQSNATVETLLELYPDIPALGAPYGTGNDTFGLNSVFKQAASLVGDLAFHALRRQLAQVFAAQKVPFYAYLFSEPQPQNPPAYGGAYLKPSYVALKMYYT
jgi:acetylcholinesterase